MKNNLFIRLYILIVTSIIVIGIGINWVWQNNEIQQLVNANFDSTPDSDDSQNFSNLKQYELLITSIAFQIQNRASIAKNNHDLDSHLYLLGTKLNLNIDLISADAIPEEAFPANKILILNNIKNTIDSNAIYFQLQDLNKILRVHIPENIHSLKHSDRSQFEILFLILFYGLVALVIFYWIWPLSKDLNHLQKALKNFDADNWQSKLDFPSSSPISHLARAYNQLLDKIKRMIESEKSMANSISHELRTPLARVRFALQMAKESNNQDFIVRQIQSAEEDIEEMNQLISEILSYASIDNQAFKPQFSKGDLGALLELLIARLEKNFPNHKIEYFNQGNTKLALCDSALIERATQNLIVNACKYGKNHIKVSLKEYKNSYQISVANDGKMIETQQIKNIFDAYYQIPSIEKTTGFGLGLSLVKRIADLHQGTILVQQSALGGAEFIFKWPKNRF